MSPLVALVTIAEIDRAAGVCVDVAASSSPSHPKQVARSTEIEHAARAARLDGGAVGL